MAFTKVTRAKKRTAVVNMAKRIGLVTVIKMADREKAPGLREEDW